VATSFHSSAASSPRFALTALKAALGGAQFGGRAVLFGQTKHENWAQKWLSVGASEARRGDHCWWARAPVTACCAARPRDSLRQWTGNCVRCCIQYVVFAQWASCACLRSSARRRLGAVGWPRVACPSETARPFRLRRPNRSFALQLDRKHHSAQSTTSPTSRDNEC